MRMDVRLRQYAIHPQFPVQCTANRVRLYVIHRVTIQRDGHCLPHVHLLILIVPILTHAQQVVGLMNNFVLEEWIKMVAQCLIIVSIYSLGAMYIVMHNAATTKYYVLVNMTL